jgi:outer membrane protein insertion porin family
VRGFRFEEAGPQGVLEPRTCEQQKQANPNATCVQELPTLVPLGGDALAVLNFELRYPLTRRLQLVPFYDVGNVFRNLKDVFSSRCVEPQGQTTARVMNNICAEWTNTVGFGLRFNTPLGPVGVDYGYLLNSPTFLNAGCEVSPQQCGQLRRPRGVIHIRFGQTF